MPRRSALRDHPRLLEIEKDLIEGDRTLKDMAAEYDVTISQLHRYRHANLAKKMAVATAHKKAAAHRIEFEQAVSAAEHEIMEGDTLLREVTRITQRVRKLFDACDRYLTDPEDPERYTLTTRAEEVMVTIEEESGGRLTQRKMTLQEAIDMAHGVNIVHARNLSNDPRTLILTTAKSLEGQMKLIIDYAAELRQQQDQDITRSPQWAEFRTELLKALEAFPEARDAILDLYEHSMG